LVRLHDNKLPFSQRSIDIVKSIMIAKDTLEYVIRAKTGWGFHDELNIGWYVGYVETNDNVYYFANCIQTGDSDNEKFATARKEIVYKIMNELKIVRP
jgi:beta-lactamase class D